MSRIRQDPSGIELPTMSALSHLKAALIISRRVQKVIGQSTLVLPGGHSPASELVAELGQTIAHIEKAIEIETR